MENYTSFSSDRYRSKFKRTMWCLPWPVRLKHINTTWFRFLSALFIPRPEECYASQTVRISEECPTYNLYTDSSYKVITGFNVNYRQSQQFEKKEPKSWILFGNYKTMISAGSYLKVCRVMRTRTINKHRTLIGMLTLSWKYNFEHHTVCLVLSLGRRPGTLSRHIRDHRHKHEIYNRQERDGDISSQCKHNWPIMQHLSVIPFIDIIN